MAGSSLQYDWYKKLVKPSWSPPAWLFGPVWSFLYLIILISFGWVAVKVISGDLSLATGLPFALNLAFNLIFTPIQFRLKNNVLSMADILLVLATLIWSLAAIWPHAHWIVYANIPYLLWVSFATCLQITITYLNRGNRTPAA